MKNSKGDELFYRITLRDDFQGAVRDCRREFAISVSGLKDRGDIKQWYESTDKSRYGRFLDVLGDILLSYRLSQGFINQLESYVLTGDMSKPYFMRPHPFAEIDVSGKIAAQNRKRKKPFVSLLIYDFSSLKETQAFLKRLWPRIKAELKQQGGLGRRIRRASYNERNKDIAELYEKPREELGTKTDGYKQIIVARLIKDKHGDVDADVVKSAAMRMRKMRKGKS